MKNVLKHPQNTPERGSNGVAAMPSLSPDVPFELADRPNGLEL